ncbi:MAG: hypothetical protein KDD61_14195 [Bdellovibrionales bacterium]|nr:hypothetical protein [Bdellovibrionales bacterium]
MKNLMFVLTCCFFILAPEQVWAKPVIQQEGNVETCATHNHESDDTQTNTTCGDDLIRGNNVMACAGKGNDLSWQQSPDFEKRVALALGLPTDQLPSVTQPGSK